MTGLEWGSRSDRARLPMGAHHATPAVPLPPQAMLVGGLFLDRPRADAQGEARGDPVVRSDVLGAIPRRHEHLHHEHQHRIRLLRGRSELPADEVSEVLDRQPIALPEDGIQPPWVRGVGEGCRWGTLGPERSP